MGAVGADDVVAVDSDDVVACAVGDEGRVEIHVVRRHVLGVVDDLAAHPVARRVEVASHLGLAVDHDGAAAGMLREVDPVEPAVVSDEEAVMNLAFPVHPLAAVGLAHEVREAVLEDTRPDAPEHVLAALAFEHDRVDALEMQQLRQQEPRGPAADDADLHAHGVPLLRGRARYCAVSPPSTVNSAPVVNDDSSLAR